MCIFKMKEINGITICVNEICQLLDMNQCNKNIQKKIYFFFSNTNHIIVLSLGQYIISLSFYKIG